MSSLPTVFFSEDPVVSFRFVDLTPPFCAWFWLPFSTRGMPAADSSHLRAPWELCSCPGRLHVSHELKRRIPLPYVLLFVAIVIYIYPTKKYTEESFTKIFAPFVAFASWQTANNVPAESMWAMEMRCKDRGGSRIFFFRRGCTRFLLYFNTNKPHSFFFLQNTSCIRKPQVISAKGGGDAHPMHPPPRSAPEGPFIYHLKRKRNIFGLFLKTTSSPSSKYEHRRTSPFNA